MVGSTGVMTMRLIRSKIRKREDSSVVDTVNVETPLPHQRHTNHHHHHSSNQQYHQNLQQQYQNGKTASDHPQNNNNCNQTNNNNSGVWVFPPLPPQPNIYSVNHVSIYVLIRLRIAETLGEGIHPSLWPRTELERGEGDEESIQLEVENVFGEVEDDRKRELGDRQTMTGEGQVEKGDKVHCSARVPLN